MSYSPAQVSGQVRDIQLIASQVSDCDVALTTNKRSVICCLSKRAANEIKAYLAQAGYFSEVAKGLVTDRLYVCAYFNDPY